MEMGARALMNAEGVDHAAEADDCRFAVLIDRPHVQSASLRSAVRLRADAKTTKMSGNRQLHAGLNSLPMNCQC
jgi:hypothetical protein